MAPNTSVLKPKLWIVLFHVIVGLFALQCGSSLAPGSWKRDRDALTEPNRDVVKDMKREIQKFYGAPYLWGGDTPRGTDCSGMIKTIYKNAVDINLPHNADEISKLGVSVSKRRLMFGDLVFFSNLWSGRATHMGMYIDRGYFLHASSSRGVVLSKLNDKPYNRQFVGAKRILDY